MKMNPLTLWWQRDGWLAITIGIGVSVGSIAAFWRYLAPPGTLCWLGSECLPGLNLGWWMLAVLSVYLTLGSLCFGIGEWWGYGCSDHSYEDEPIDSAAYTTLFEGGIPQQPAG